MSSLLQRIDAVLEERNMLKHPFYQTWNDGKLTREALRNYACQYYHFVKDFPRMVSAVHSNTPELALRQELLENLMDEELGAGNHPGLWMDFAHATGASNEEVLNARPLPTTTALVDTMMSICREGSFQEGLASLYSYEAQIPEVSRVKIEGLIRFYDIKQEQALKFFTVHKEADVIHSQSERDMLSRATTPHAEEPVVRASAKTAQALWGFLDGVYEAYVKPRARIC
jgi:pyrroloquinoline-quinone synthase